MKNSLEGLKGVKLVVPTVEPKVYMAKYVGKIYKSNTGSAVEVISGGSKVGFAEVKFLATGCIKEVLVASLKKGMVKDPCSPTVNGVGFMGIGEYTTSQDGKHTPQYAAWKSMMKRAYSAKYHILKPTYSKVTICKEWHNFQNFASWYDNHYVSGYELDKDILQHGVESKVYSPDTAVYVPSEVNNFIQDVSKRNSSGVVGVMWRADRKCWVASIGMDKTSKYLGQFDTRADAILAYSTARELRVAELQVRYKGIIADYVLTKLV